jgi:hypothetical protein
MDSTGSGQGPVVGCCKCGDGPSSSCATELVSLLCKENTNTRNLTTYGTTTLSFKWFVSLDLIFPLYIPLFI